MRQRKLLLPPFHGEAIERYTQMIAAAAEREIDRWPLGEPFALAPRMQAITLDVIMAGIFGIEGRPAARHARAPAARRRSSAWSAPRPCRWRSSPSCSTSAATRRSGLMKLGLALLDRPIYAVIARAAARADLDERRDILSLLLQARTEEGEALSDKELRDELLTLVLAGHETTANSLAWAWERLVRNPDAHEALRERGPLRRGRRGAGRGDDHRERCARAR